MYSLEDIKIICLDYDKKFPQDGFSNKNGVGIGNAYEGRYLYNFISSSWSIRNLPPISRSVWENLLNGLEQ